MENIITKSQIKTITTVTDISISFTDQGKEYTAEFTRTSIYDATRDSNTIDVVINNQVELCEAGFSGDDADLWDRVYNGKVYAGGSLGAKLDHALVLMPEITLPEPAPQVESDYPFINQDLNFDWDLVPYFPDGKYEVEINPDGADATGSTLAIRSFGDGFKIFYTYGNIVDAEADKLLFELKTGIKKIDAASGNLADLAPVASHVEGSGTPII